MKSILQFAFLFLVLLGLSVLTTGVYTGNFDLATWAQETRKAAILVPLAITSLAFVFWAIF